MTAQENPIEDTDRWLDIDPSTEPINNLRLVAELLLRVEDQPYLWKWIVIALHNAVQAHMLLAIWGGDHRSAMSDRYLQNYKNKNSGSDTDAWRGDYHVAPFGDLYAKVKEAEPLGRRR
jgi:hypothetical protein